MQNNSHLVLNESDVNDPLVPNTTVALVINQADTELVLKALSKDMNLSDVSEAARSLLRIVQDLKINIPSNTGIKKYLSRRDSNIENDTLNSEML